MNSLFASLFSLLPLLQSLALCNSQVNSNCAIITALLLSVHCITLVDIILYRLKLFNLFTLNKSKGGVEVTSLPYKNAVHGGVEDKVNMKCTYMMEQNIENMAE